jgi:maltose O-acetyltransferase
MRERMLAGDLYIANDPELEGERRRARTLTHRLDAMDPNDVDARRAVLLELLGALGEGGEILPPFRCDYGYQISIGARSFINYGAIFLDVAPITVGADVQMGPNVQLLTATHPVEAEPRRAKWESAKPIVIGDNAWLGGGVIVGPGVTIGANSVIAAGAVVVRDVPPDVVAVGNPARVIRQLRATGRLSR